MAKKRSSASSTSRSSNNFMNQQCSDCKKWRKIGSDILRSSTAAKKKGWTCREGDCICGIAEEQSASSRKNKKRNSTKISEAAQNTNVAENAHRLSASAKTKSATMPRRSGRRGGSDGAPLLSITYNYPGGKAWDSLKNCWVSKEEDQYSEKKIRASSEKKIPALAGSSSLQNGDAMSMSPKTESTVAKLTEIKMTSKGTPTGGVSKLSTGTKKSKEGDLIIVSPLKRRSSASSHDASDPENNLEQAKDQIKSRPAQDSENEALPREGKSKIFASAKRREKSNSSPQQNDEQQSNLLGKDSPADDEANQEVVESQTFLVDPSKVNVNDFCYICKFDGNLIECYAERKGKAIGCGKSVHLHCVGREKVPSGDWICSGCAKYQELPLPKDKNPNSGYEFDADLEKQGLDMDLCFVCNAGGELIECFAEKDGREIGCSKGAHASCIGRRAVPEGDWICTACANKEELRVSESKNPHYGHAFPPPEAWTQVSLGTRIAVYWPGDETYYKARVMSHDGGSLVEILYDDGVRENLDLSKEQIEILRQPGESHSGTMGRNTFEVSSDAGSIENAFRTNSKAKLNNEEARIAALGPNDIVCGVDETQAGWIRGYAYHEFQKIIDAHYDEYKDSSSSVSNRMQSRIREKILELLCDEDLRFVSWNGEDWEPLSHDRSLSIISDSFRDDRRPLEAFNDYNPPIAKVRRNQIPLGRANAKELKRRPAYRFFANLIENKISEYSKAQNKRTVCLQIFIQLAREGVSFVDVCPSTRRWEEVSKDRTVARIMRAFQARRLKQSSELRSAHRRKHSTFVRRRLNVDPSFLLESYDDIASEGDSSIDDSSDSESESESDQESHDESVQSSTFENAQIGSGLLDLCSQIRANRILDQRINASQAFHPALDSSPYTFFYQPRAAKKPRVSMQYDMICEIVRGPINPAAPPFPAPLRRPPSPSKEITMVPMGSFQPQRTTHSAGRPSTSAHTPPASTQIRLSQDCFHENRLPAAGQLQPFQRNQKPPPQPMYHQKPPPQPMYHQRPPPPKNYSNRTSTVETRTQQQQEEQSNDDSRYLGPPRQHGETSPLSPEVAAICGPATDTQRFLCYQVEVWTTRLNEAKAFRKKYGHCIIPHDYTENPLLARWAKRQRYQYQLYKNNSGKHYMTPQRIRALEKLGFCWEHKTSVWFQRYNELQEFIGFHGHTLVPTGYPKNKKLATWVKCQRRQRKLREKGQPHCISEERIGLLDRIHFAWQVNGADDSFSSSPPKKIKTKAKAHLAPVVPPPSKTAKTASRSSNSNGNGNERKGLTMFDSATIGEEERKIREKYKQRKLK